MTRAKWSPAVPTAPSSGTIECPLSLTWCQYGPAHVGLYVACPECGESVYVMANVAEGGGLWARHQRRAA